MHRSNEINSKFFVRINGHLHMTFGQSCSQSKVYWVGCNTNSPALSLICLSQWKCLFTIVQLTLVFLDVCKRFIDNHICKVANSPLKYPRLESRVKYKFLIASVWWADVDGKWSWFLQNQQWQPTQQLCSCTLEWPGRYFESSFIIYSSTHFLFLFLQGARETTLLPCLWILLQSTRRWYWDAGGALSC